MQSPVTFLIILATAFLATVAGTWWYRTLAIRRGILANPNFRSSHQQPVPRGGGLVLALVAVVTMLTVAWLAQAEGWMLAAVAGGGLAASLSGFLDDVFHIGALRKLATQSALAAWVLDRFGGQPLVDVSVLPGWVELIASWVALVWLLNLYNFMDGIDGMAASGAVTIGGALMLLLWLSSPGDPTFWLVGTIVACNLGFLVFNWPKANIFMGDAGSLFLGLSFGALIVSTVTRAQVSLWTWLVVFGYFAIDTTTTTTLRIFVTERWYGEHRSHAYQNLARVGGSHLAVVRGVVVYHMVWLLPLAVLSHLRPEFAALAAGCAVVPVVIWTFRYGPLLSSS